jgi:nitroimidazol reductase NimA-like FMN-containing flavoprotein (pyridoxamine 5'-phosphate oxidase superfamily)
MRRADKEMSASRASELLATAYCGRLASVGPDGAPYVCPLLYVWRQGQVWLHNTSALGHLQRNILHEPRVCFEVDVPGEAYAYGRFQCDTALEYQSVLVFGQLEVIRDRDQKAAFFDALMSKYYAQETDRPTGFYPRLDEVTVYALRVDRITGKETSLPAAGARWPFVDKTKSPNAVPPRKDVEGDGD